MLLIKILIWLSVYFIFYILFSLNTLISIFCFIIVIFITCILLLKLHIEYLTFLILLLYLGGILIFFLFTALMLSNEYNSIKNSTTFSLENIFIIIIFFKIFFILTFYNEKISYFKSLLSQQYLTINISNDYFMTSLMSNHNDVLNLLSLYSEKWFLLIILGMILLFTMIGVIVITRSKHV